MKDLSIVFHISDCLIETVTNLWLITSTFSVLLSLILIIGWCLFFKHHVTGGVFIVILGVDSQYERESYRIWSLGWASQWLIWGRIQAWFHYCIPHFSCRLETVLSVCVYDLCTMLCFRLWYLPMDSLSTWSWMTEVTSPIWFMRNTHNISRVSKVSREIKRTCIHKKLSVFRIKCCYFAVANTPN